MRIFERKEPQKGDNRAINEPKMIEPHRDLVCENAIIEDHARFGRVRTSLMRELRGLYSEEVANRAMWRVSRRLRLGYLVGDDHLKEEKVAMKTARRLRSISELVKDEDRIDF